ncbi:uncharacterized GPI-anchored protein At1g61900-like [Coffea eugenioides]|uniref:uncharacterized GPI-anchored protein At1g61900-like n=1 Tax=Coffea eugenioides TaxID=49369 RepID=UPI000F609C48|nr:uncharacterized GPI-anchored protein At1g61900-like [Coffea eugenioides]
MKEVVPEMILLHLLLLNIYVPLSMIGPYESIGSSDAVLKRHFISSLYVSPSTDLQPLATPHAPSPLMPFTYNGLPNFSGCCMLNFFSAESISSVIATDCWSSLAPYLANVVCCP